jgi:hypothetical protein
MKSIRNKTGKGHGSNLADAATATASSTIPAQFTLETGAKNWIEN